MFQGVLEQAAIKLHGGLNARHKGGAVRVLCIITLLYKH